MDASGKIYLFFSEGMEDGSGSYFHLATSNDDGVSWIFFEPTKFPADRAVYDLFVAVNGVIYQLWGNTYPPSLMELRTSTDFINWDVVGSVPTGELQYYKLHVSNSGYAVIGLSGACTDANGKTHRSII